jgi:hypothetical protein
VHVQNCYGDVSATVAADAFTYLAPKVTSISPTSGVAGTQITIKGTNLRGNCLHGGSAVYIGNDGFVSPLSGSDGYAAWISGTDTQIVIKVPFNTPGSYDVHVQDCAGDVSASVSTDKFTYGS